MAWADTYVDAIAHLLDITYLHTDSTSRASSIAKLRADLLRDDSNVNSTLSRNLIPVLEVLGIARAVATRFSGQELHHAHADRAILYASMLVGDAQLQFKLASEGDADAATSLEDDGRYRAFLLKYLDWVHSDAATGTHLCPVTAYLQLILRGTPMEDWPTAVSDAAASRSDASPLAFAWAWARQQVGPQTADVVVLVTTGRHAHRLLAHLPVKAREERGAARPALGDTILQDGLLIAVVVTAQYYLKQLRTRRLSHAARRAHKRQLEEEKDTLAATENAADQLGTEGTKYAQLLGAGKPASERAAVASSIRAYAGYILGKAGLPGSEGVLGIIDDLARADD